MKIKLLVAAAATVVASSAMAQSAFEGVNVQLGVGYNLYNPQLTDTPGAGNTDPANSFSYGNGGSVAVRPGVGYTAAFGNTFSLGGLVEYDIVNSKAVSTSVNGQPDSTFTLQQKNKTTFSLMPGVAINPTTLAYLKLGYSTFKTQACSDSCDSITSGSYNYGLGVKKLIDKNIYVFGEGNYSTIQNKNQSYTDGTGSTKFAGSSYNLIVGVGYKF